MVPLVHLQVVIRVVIMTAVVIMGVVPAVIPAMIVTAAATRRASPMYTLKIVTNLTVRKVHTCMAVHIVKFAQLASTHLQVRRECLLRCLLFSHPIACDIRMCVVA